MALLGNSCCFISEITSNALVQRLMEVVNDSNAFDPRSGHSVQKSLNLRVSYNFLLPFDNSRGEILMAMENKKKNLQQKPKAYECKICAKVLKNSSASNIQRHMKIHNDTKSFECEICSSKFLSDYKLKVHQQLHTGTKEFNCDFCGKGFAQSGKLTSHLLVHAGEKPFECDFCEKCFTSSGDLTKHTRIHTEIKLKCKFCEKQFASSSNLSKHIRIHTAEKPFKCDICDKGFTQSANLSTHFRTDAHILEKNHSNVTFVKRNSFRKAIW